MRKFVFLLLLMGAFGYGLAQPLAVDTSVFGHVPSAQRLTYWFDAASGERQSVTLSQGAGELDVSLLPTGVHTLHCYAVDSAGVAYPTRSAMFFCPPAMGAASAGAMVYWFDAAFASRQSVPLGGGTRLLDVSVLPTGMHTLHCYAVGADGRVYPTSSAMFFCPPAMGAASAGAMVYWFDEDFSIRQRVALNGGPQMLDVSALPVGMHTLHCYAVGADGRVYPTSSVMFFRPPYVNTDSVAAQEVVYWFDEDFASRQRAAAERSAVLLMDVSALQVGMHTLHCYAVGSDSTVYPTRSAMFFRPPYVNTDSVAAQEVVYWFDEDFAERQHVASLSALQTIDVSALQVGMHTLHSYAVGRDSTVYPTRSAMFFRPPQMGSDSVAAQEVVYWFDGDYAGRQQVASLSALQTIDVSSLSIGVHTLHCYAVGMDGKVYPTSSTMFFRPPVAGSEGGEGISQYYYWVNEGIDHATRVVVNPVTNPLQWYGLVPMDPQPFRSSYFHFELDTAQQPHAYAKNTFHTLFMDDMGRFVMGDAPFIDYHVSQPVVWDTILPNTSESFAKVTNNSIKWFRLTAQTGDSLSFKSDMPCTLQLFDPTGAEVYHASGDSAIHFDGTHAWHDGTYYLAVHDVSSNRSNTQTVEYQHFNKYVVLAHTPTEVGNTPGAFILNLKGNGFDKLTSATLVKNSIEWGHDTLSHQNRTMVDIRYLMDTATVNGVYDLRLCFEDEEHVLDTLIVAQALTVEDAVFGTIDVSYDFVVTTSSPHYIIVRFHNTGNVAYQAIPIYVGFTGTTPEHVWLHSDAFYSDGEYHTDFSETGYATDNLLQTGRSGYVGSMVLDRLDGQEVFELKLEYNVPAGNGFDFYSWTGVPWSEQTEEAKAADARYCASHPNSPGWGNTTGTSPHSSHTSGCASDTFRDACDIPDPCEAVSIIGSVFNIEGIDPIECGCGIFMGTIKSFANSFAAIAYSAYRARNEYLVQNGCEPTYQVGRLQTPGSILREALGHCTGLINNRIVQTATNTALTAWDMMSDDCVGPDPIHPYVPAPPCEPNDIIGPTSESGSLYVTANQYQMPYLVESENAPIEGISAAHTVVVRDTLSPNVFDFASFATNRVTIGNKVLDIDNEQNFVRTLDIRPNVNVIAQIAQTFDTNTGEIKWVITSLDPMTLDPTDDPELGVMPPNLDGRGEATFSYVVNRKDNLPDGTTIPNQAHIVFDYEAPIATPIWTNTVDAVPPTSSIVYGNMAGDSITLSFQGTDNRSGVWRYELYGRDDALSDWRIVANNIEHSVYMMPIDSTTTDFYVVAIDSAGNRESKAAQAEYNTVRGVVGPAVTTYQIQFVNYDNTVLGSYRLPMGAMPAYLGVPRRNADRGYSYQFSGWRPSLAPVTGNAVYRAEYDSLPNSYRVSFYDYDSTLLQEDSLPYGTLPTYYSMIPTREVADSFVYAFVGWEPALAPVTGNAAYRPVFDSMVYHQLPRYLVTFRNWNDSTLQADSLMFGQMPNYWGTEPTRDGGAYCEYRFRGWRPQLSPATGNATYTAVFDTLVHTYPVTFVNFNGAVLQRDTLPYGSMPVYRGNTPARRTTIQYTYQFAGWSPNVDTVRGEAVYTALFDSVFSCISQYHYDDVATCDTVTWRGSQYAATGTYTNTVVGAAYGCDSIYVLNLTVNSRSFTTDFQTACDSYSWHGQSYTASATDVDTLANAAGCDSVVTLHLTLHHSNTGSETVTACDSYSWHGQSYTASATDVDTLANAAGCDSVVTLHLTLYHSNTGSETVTACDSYSWHGQSYTASATDVDTLANAAGCDSVVTLHLTLNYSSTGSETVTACDSYSWHGQSYMASTTAFDTLTNAVSCDSIVTLNLTLNYSDAVTETIAACDSYSWHGQSYTASATDVDTLANAAGCDSVVTLHLTINYSSTGIDLQTACDSLLWHGNVYTSSTDTPTFTMQSSAGCDSVVTLHLTLHNATRNELELADCDSIVWSEMTFYSSGDTCVILTNSAGCDSLNMLHLSVGHSERDTIIDTAVGSYEWNGTTYTESGEYLFSSQTEAGCDSIITLILTITQTEGILPRDMEQATLYPNPTTGKITIDGVKAVRIEVYDLDGRMLCTFSNTNSFDISKLPSGTYFIRIFSPQGEARQRVIKY